MPVIGMHISAGGFHGCVAEDLLEDVQRHASVGHLVVEFSSRSRQIEQEKNRLIAEYVERHGR